MTDANMLDEAEREWRGEAREERRLFWRGVAIVVIVAVLVFARAVLG